LTTKELADRLKVPLSWVYGQTRQKGNGTIPSIKVGKYYRFLESDVLSWLKARQTVNGENN